MRKSAFGRPSATRRKVNQFTLAGELITTYSSVKEAYEALDYNYGNGNSLSGLAKRTKGKNYL